MAARRLSFSDAALPPSTEEIRGRIRQHLADELAAGRYTPRCDTWLSGHDPDFSKRLGAAGFLGLTWPKQYGGHERTHLERYVVIEEMLAHHAPTRAYSTADRQSGPMILRYGQEEIRRTILPRISRWPNLYS